MRDLSKLTLNVYTNGYITCLQVTIFMSWTYCAHVKALSSAAKDPPTKGLGGFGSLAIHHPTGTLTAFNPFSDMNLKSSSTMYVLQ